MTVYLYNLPDTMDSEDYYTLKSNYDDYDGKWIAEQAAEDYHTRHDGWDAHWPVTLEIRREDHSVIDIYVVDREAVPEFTARKADR